MHAWLSPNYNKCIYEYFSPHFFFPAVAVIRASELWAAMEPELLVTVRTVVEPTSETEKEQHEEEEDRDVEEEKPAEDDRETAVMIAQLLRISKYR